MADLDAESWDRIVADSGISRELIKQAAEIALESERMICCWAMGITQHKNGVANVQSIVNFALLRGQIGRRGAGLCPVRGHSNVQGDRTVGIWEKMSDAFLEALGKEFQFQPPRKHGFDTVRTIQAMHEGRVKVFVGLGGNFLSATPDTHYTSEAMARCRLTVQISTKLNRGHLITGAQALILPCLGRTEKDLQASGEQFVTVEDTTGVVHASRGVLEPASPHLRSEPAIIAGIALATLGARTTVDWDGLVADYDRIREHIEHVVPGFAQYNRRVREPGGFYLPNGPREGTFTTPSKRARFTVHPIPERDAGAGAAAADDVAQPRSVQHDDLRRRRSLPRHLRRPARRVPERRGHARAGHRPGSERRSREPPRRRAAARGAVPRRPVRDPARVCRSVLSGN